MCANRKVDKTKKQENESEAERLNRLAGLANQIRVAGIKQDNALDAMVRRSIELHGP